MEVSEARPEVFRKRDFIENPKLPKAFSSQGRPCHSYADTDGPSGENRF
jgi:hypothetical protein